MWVGGSGSMGGDRHPHQIPYFEWRTYRTKYTIATASPIAITR